MRTFIYYASLGAIMYLSLFLISSKLSTSSVRSLTSEEAKQMLKNKSIKHIIDVRTDAEWKEGHLKDAIHIPLDVLSKDISKVDKLSKSDTILLYCRSGGRANTGATILSNNGYTNVYYLVGSHNSLN